MNCNVIFEKNSSFQNMSRNCCSRSKELKNSDKPQDDSNNNSFQSTTIAKRRISKKVSAKEPPESKGREKGAPYVIISFELRSRNFTAQLMR